MTSPHCLMGVSRTRPVFGGLPALLLVSITAGCTMCPDNYDYAGPVPGSSPQTDFRVRSNGLRPIGAAARPWPRIVKAGSTRREPTLVVVAGDPDDAVAETRPELVSVLVVTPDAADDPEESLVAEADRPGAAQLEPVDPRLAEAAIPSSDTSWEDGSDDAPTAVTADTDPPIEEVLAELLPPAPPSRPEGRSPRETPGWKTRR